MEGAALSSSEFKEFAKDVVLFAHVTSHVEGDAYQNLLAEKGGRGFPHIVILDAAGDVVAKPPSRDVAGFKAAVSDASKFVELKDKEDPTVAEQVELLGLQISLGNYDFAAAKEAAGKIKGMDDAQKEKVANLLLPFEIRSLIPPGRNPTPEARQAAGKAFAEMYKAGKVPPDQQTMQPFFIFMLDYAEAQKDAKLFADALGKLEAEFGSNPRAAGFFKAQQDRLAKLEAGAGD